MSDEYYLLDNNVVAKLTFAQRRSKLFLEQCRIPDEVIHEAGAGLRSELQALRYTTTAAVLESLKTVMATVPPGDSKLVDLYRNQGNADPFLVACAVLEQTRGDEMLVTPRWVIVTDDKEVRTKAVEFGVRWMSHRQFVSLLTDAV